MEQHIASIAKNALDTIEVGFKEFKGANYLDIRIYAEFEGKPGRQPTKRGVTLRPSLIPELIEALQRAEAEARAAGLLT